MDIWLSFEKIKTVLKNLQKNDHLSFFTIDTCNTADISYFLTARLMLG